MSHFLVFCIYSDRNPCRLAVWRHRPNAYRYPQRTPEPTDSRCEGRVFYVVEFVHGRKKKRLPSLTNSSTGHLGLRLALGRLLTADLDALQDVLAVLVELELGDDDLAGVDADGDARAGNLLACDPLDVDDILEAVDREDLALLVLVEASDNLDLVTLPDGDAADLERK